MPATTRPVLLVLGRVLLARNLRPALSSVSLVLAQVQQALGLSATAAGLLTTLPVLCLGVFAPLAPRLAQRLDAERAVFAVLFVLAAGTALRGAFGWLPTILIERGVSALQAGFLLSLVVLLQLVTAFSGPWLATQIGRDQRPVLWLMLTLALAGLLGSLWAPLGSLWRWAVLLGLGQGGQSSVALLLMVLRAPNPQRAAQLSGMAQGLGYTLAALGPLAVGLWPDATGGAGGRRALRAAHRGGGRRRRLGRATQAGARLKSQVRQAPSVG